MENVHPMPQTPIADLLERIPFFAGLDGAVLNDIHVIAKPLFMKEGEFLFRQGQAADGMYLIESGAVRIWVNLPGGGAREVARIGENSFVGEIGLVDNGPRSADALVETDVCGYFISNRRIDAMRKELDSSAFALLSRFSELVGSRCRDLLHRLGGTKPSASEETRPEDTGEGSATETAFAPCQVPLHALPAGIPFLNVLSRRDLDLMSRITRGIKVRRGECLISQNSRPNRVYFLIRGAVSTLLPVGGKFHQVAVQGPGSLVGQLGFIDGISQPLTYVAAENSVLLEIDQLEFERIRQGNTALSFRFIEFISTDSVKLLRKINGLAARLSTGISVDSSEEVKQAA